jgi:tetratricopeptide (TPR) repeat protein
VSNHFLHAVTGSFFNPGPFGGYLAFIFALSVSVLVKMRGKGEEFLCAVRLRQFKNLLSIDTPLYFVSFAASVLSFILLPSTMSRSAWMAACAAALIAFIELGSLRKVQIRLSNHKRLLVPTVLIVSAIAFAAIFAVYSLKKGSADARLFSWQISAKIIAGNPVTGTGAGYFGGAYATLQAQYFAENPDSEYIRVADCPDYAFNEFLQIGTELGLAGLVLFAAVIILALRNVFKTPNPFQYGLIAILVFSFTSYPFHIIPLLVLFTVSIAVQKGTTLPCKLTGKAFPVIISIAVFAAWPVSRPLMREYIEAQTEWKKLSALYAEEICDTGGYAELFPVLKYDRKFLFEYGHSLSKLGEYEKSSEILRHATKLSNDPMFHNIIGNNYLALKDYDNAEKSYRTAYNIVPNRIYPLYLLTRLCLERGDTAKAMNMCRKVMNFKPKVHSNAVMEIRAEIKELMNRADSIRSEREESPSENSESRIP